MVNDHLFVIRIVHSNPTNVMNLENDAKVVDRQGCLNFKHKKWLETLSLHDKDWPTNQTKAVISAIDF